MARVDREEPRAGSPVRLARGLGRLAATIAIGGAVLSLGSLASLAACGGGAGGPAGKTSAKSASVGGRAADFTARDINGKTVRLSDYLGKQTVLLHFCATWCTPCLAELSHLNKIYDKHKAEGFVVLAIAMDSSDSVAEVPSWARRNNIVFPVLLDEDSQIASIYNPKKSAPLTVLIDKTASIVHVHDGYNPGDEVDLEKHVASALAAVDTGAAPK